MGIGKINKVKVDLKSYPPYIFLAEPKFGKTGFWDGLVKKAWKSSDRGLLLAFEKGYLSYDGLSVYDVDKWADFVEAVNYISKNPGEYDGVCIDTLDAMIDCATKEVLRLHKIECGTPCKSLLDAFKGYGRGKQRLLDLCNEQIAKLRKAGVAVFILAHTKKRNVKDLLTGEEYEAVTNNLTSDIYNNFANDAQMIMVGVKERTIQEGRLVDEKRVVYLRGNSFIEAGGRFTDLPDTISGDREVLVEEFLDAFENAVKNSITTGKNDDKTIAKMRKEEAEEASKKSTPKPEPEIDETDLIETDELPDDVELAEPVEDAEPIDNGYPDNLADVIRDQFKACKDADKKKEVKAIIAEFGKLVDVDEDGLKKIYDILN